MLLFFSAVMIMLHVWDGGLFLAVVEDCREAPVLVMPQYSAPQSQHCLQDWVVIMVQSPAYHFANKTWNLYKYDNRHIFISHAYSFMFSYLLKTLNHYHIYDLYIILKSCFKENL